MRSLLLAFLVMLSSIAHTQERVDLGLLGGASYYFGDFNYGEQFYQPSPSAGVLLRYNFSEHYTFRISGTYGRIQGNHTQNDYYLPTRTVQERDFSSPFFGFEMIVEVSFMAFDTRTPFNNNFSPYLSLGVGFAIVESHSVPNIPIGIGTKIALGGRWAMGVEWRLHKTLNDSLDGYENYYSGSRSTIHNNDWFGIGGLILTYRLENNRAICPAYM